MKVLLVEPRRSRKYHTAYPPLGLLKLAAYHKKRGRRVEFISGLGDAQFYPDRICITSLFTYAWEPVHEAIRYYSMKYRKSEIIVGGIYATLCKDHLIEAFQDRIRVHTGICSEVEDILPDYSLVPSWNASIVFSSRGCIRECPFCAVGELEPEFEAKRSVKHLIKRGHTKIVFWDNNVLASPHWENVFAEVEELGLQTDFNQGIDARLLTPLVAERISRLNVPIVRLAYDTMGIRDSLMNAIDLLKQVGFRGRSIVVYCMYNYPTKRDTPAEFLERIRDLMDWGVVAYPMRYEPLEPRVKNSFVSPYWDSRSLEMVARSRRVLGYGGALPPYEGLRKKLLNAKDFGTAFNLRAARQRS